NNFVGSFICPLLAVLWPICIESQKTITNLAAMFLWHKANVVIAPVNVALVVCGDPAFRARKGSGQLDAKDLLHSALDRLSRANSLDAKSSGRTVPRARLRWSRWRPTRSSVSNLRWLPNCHRVMAMAAA